MDKKKFSLSLFIFRRDLRLFDNTALIAACKQSDQVIPCFIFDTRQTTTMHDYFSEKAFAFMLQSLMDLQKDCEKQHGHLYFFNGLPEIILEKLLIDLPIDAIFVNRDYTPFSLQRDQLLEKIAIKNQRAFFSYGDLLLHEPEEIAKQNGEPYVVYTPFMKKSRELPVAKPSAFVADNFYRQSIAMHDATVLQQYYAKYKQFSFVNGGRVQAKKLIDHLPAIHDYAKNRDFPEKNATTHLSAHHKFGTISVRESYLAMSQHPDKMILTNELYWRDFFTHIAFHFPHVFEGAFHSHYQHIEWSNNDQYFDAWCRGKTGFPIVDAGMRELNETGYMHNRVRMITASFLVKDLHIDWRWGERYFAQKLTDYDPAVNNGNWQWAASTGCDAQPYFRIFNPTLQQKRFDPNGSYIAHWVPELRDGSVAYPSPMVDHAIQSAVIKQRFQAALGRIKSS